MTEPNENDEYCTCNLPRCTCDEEEERFDPNDNPGHEEYIDNIKLAINK